MSRYIKKSTIEKIERPVKLDSSSEARALEFLAKNRARPMYDSSKPIGKIVQNQIPGKGEANKQRLNSLILRWKEIIGENTSKLCQPEAIKGKTLVLRVNGAAASLLQMRSKEILGLASLASGISLNKLSFIQAPNKKPASTRTIIKPLDAAQSAILEEKLKNVHSEGLKNAIRMLNTYIQNQS